MTFLVVEPKHCQECGREVQKRCRGLCMTCYMRFTRLGIPLPPKVRTTRKSAPSLQGRSAELAAEILALRAEPTALYFPGGIPIGGVMMRQSLLAALGRLENCPLKAPSGSPDAFQVAGPLPTRGVGQ